MAAAFCVAGAGRMEAANADPQKTRELIGVLQSSADVFARARACQQLAIVGTPEAVPALAALLNDEKLSLYARDALEVMPDPSAVDALRDALGRVQGNQLVGVINSLGMRRDTRAVPALGKLASGQAPAVAGAALVALGRIATPEAARVVQQSLSSGSEELRIAAAEASLFLAAQNLEQGRRDAAVALYDAVRQTNLPAQLRTTATHQAIVARGEAGLPLLVQNLHSNDLARRDVALRSLRELRGPAIAPAIVAEMAKAKSTLQALLIAALVERGDRSQLAAIEARADAPDEDVRVAALEALGRIGGASSVPLLLRAATRPAGGADMKAAVASLARISAPNANEAILAALRTAEPTVRARLIALLGDRNAESATTELLKLARNANADVAKAALRALALVTRPADLAPLIALAVALTDDELKTLADRAIVTTSMKVLDPPQRIEPVLAAFRPADPNTKVALLRPLGAVVRNMGGSHEAFVAVRSALKSEQSSLRDAALQCLADWPDATPATTLLGITRSSPTPAARELALRSAIRMAGNVAAGRDRSPLNAVAFLGEANALVRSPEEKMAIVSALGSARHVESFRMLQPYLDDPAVKTEAALAVVQIAPALLNSDQGLAVKLMLTKIAASGPDEDTRKKATRVAKGLPVGAAKQKGGGGAAVAAGNRAPPSLPPGTLFNGSDLAGWDGDPAVWRVRDGVMVGGSLEGNPRNEFLATKRTYRNFVLRVEYKLVGTEGFVNGGVQFRSVRVKQPPNEMSGYQADIGAGHSGKLYDESRRKKFLAEPNPEQIRRLEIPGGWNRYEITCRGPHIELALNGEKTIAYEETDRSMAPDGVVALQIHGNCKAEIMFRHVVIEELP
ncbi:MAG: DUF1080 domain-containing protein [Opitutaceae bacterium]|nr:DUF1080 domain-containing protein [Opitutaceae bacterium]